jgi:hypothetical protein
VPVVVCPYCGVSFPSPEGAARHELPCPRCGKAPGLPPKTRPWLLTGLILLLLGLPLLALGRLEAGESLALVVGGALAVVGLVLLARAVFPP